MLRQKQIKTLLLTVFGMFAACGPIVAQADFSQTDTDKNGSIDFEEFRSRNVDTFYHADGNRDGVLSDDELDILNSERLSETDVNNDQQLDLREFLNSTGSDFRNADQNGDHMLSPAELN